LIKSLLKIMLRDSVRRGGRENLLVFSRQSFLVLERGRGPGSYVWGMGYPFKETVTPTIKFPLGIAGQRIVKALMCKWSVNGLLTL
jgi:hypothetical protein